MKLYFELNDICNIDQVFFKYIAADYFFLHFSVVKSHNTVYTFKHLLHVLDFP